MNRKGEREALRHAVTAPDLELPYHAGHRGRHVHRRLLGFERDQRSLDVDRVARLNEHVDDLDVLEVAEIRDPYFDQLCHGPAPSYTDQGFGRAASMPSCVIAPFTVARSSLPSSASDLSAASAM